MRERESERESEKERKGERERERERERWSVCDNGIHLRVKNGVPIIIVK